MTQLPQLLHTRTSAAAASPAEHRHRSWSVDVGELPVELEEVDRQVDGLAWPRVWNGEEADPAGAIGDDQGAVVEPVDPVRLLQARSHEAE